MEQALELLDHARVVLGPARDGGYYLVGASDSAPPIFQGIDWSTDRVWQQTIDRLSDAGWKRGAALEVLPESLVAEPRRRLESFKQSYAGGPNGDGTDPPYRKHAMLADRLRRTRA